MPKHTTHHTSKPLELVHSDVCGPFRVNSLGGYRYFVTFIDDFSKRTWIYFIKNKSEVLSKFQHFVHLLKTMTGRTVQALRTDNGGEYTSKDFAEFCLSQGISWELPPPYTPERNGVAERRNRSLLDITRCLLLDKGLPGHLWAEVVKAAGDILNLRSTKRHPDKTPTELFYGKKPLISHLRVFGSSAFAHIPKGTRTKLDPRAEQCVLLSFDEAAKAYRCYRSSTRKVFISRDLLIDEAAPPKPSSTSITPPTTSVDFTPAPTAIENRRDHPGLPMQPTLESHIDDHLLPPTQTEPDASPMLHESSQSPPTTGCPSPSSPAPCTYPTHTTKPNQEDAEPLIPPLHFLADKAAPIHSPPADRLRRSERVRRFPKHLHDFAAHLQLHPQDLVPEDVTETLTFQQARLDPKWRHAMHEEIASIYQNQT